MARYGGRKRRKNALAVKKNEERKRVGVWYSPDAIMPALEGGVYPILPYSAVFIRKAVAYQIGLFSIPEIFLMLPASLLKSFGAAQRHCV